MSSGGTTRSCSRPWLSTARARPPPARRRAAVARRARRGRDRRRGARAPRRRRAVGRRLPLGARAAADGADARRVRAALALHAAHRGGPRGPLLRDGEYVARSPSRRGRKIYDMQTADGVPYWKIALLHLDSIASTVVQKCIYWGTARAVRVLRHRSCSRNGRTIPVKTPALLAEVCTAARDLDGAVDVTLTTGSLNRRDRGALYISPLRDGDQGGQRPAGPGPVRAARRPRRSSTRSTPPASTRSACTWRRSTPRCSRGSRRARRARGIDGYFRAWERGGRGLRPRPRHHLRDPRHGREPAVDRGGLPARDRRGRLPVRGAAAPGARDAHGRRRRRPRPTTCASVYALVSAMLAEAGFDQPGRRRRLRALPGVLGLSAWERVFEKERDGELAPAVDRLMELCGRTFVRVRLAAATPSAPRTTRCGARSSSTSRRCSPATTTTSATRIRPAR